MTLPDLLQVVRLCDIRLSACAGKLVVDAPKELMTVELRSELAVHKPALLAMLTGFDLDGSLDQDLTALDLTAVETCRAWRLDDHVSIADLIESGRAHNVFITTGPRP
jgi:hypothetical protein